MRLRALVCAEFDQRCLGVSAGICCSLMRAAKPVTCRALAMGVLLAGLVVAGIPAWGFSDHVPDWVKVAAAQPLPELPQTTKAVVLLEDTKYTVGCDGRAVEHVRRVVKILRPQGREYAYPFVRFDKDSKVLSMHVWSIDPGGHEFAMKESDFVELSPPGEGGKLYEDVKYRAAEPPGRDPGGVIAWEYERRERPYLAETSWSFQDELPHITQSFTLVLPESYKYTTTWANHAKLDGADLENHSYRWEMNGEPAIDLDDIAMAPSDAALFGRMTVHYSGPGLSQPQEGTWKGVGEWYQGLMQDRVAPTPEIAAKAAELTAGKTDFYDKAEAIGEFVQQQIRYFVIEVGVGGYQPHFAGDIFRGRYGDCKDKATLLSAMLASAGMHGTLVLVDTRRGFINQDDPSSQGDHAIAAIEVPKGYESPKLHSVVTATTGKRYLIFDPTWEKTPFGQLENNLQGGYGVLVEGADSQIIELPVMSPDLNTVKRSASLTLSADGTLSGGVTEKRFGDLAERRRMIFQRDDAKEQQAYMDRTVSRDFSAVSVTGLKIENLQTLNKDLTTSFELKAANFASATGPLLMVRPRVLGSYAPHVDRKTRKVSIDLEETMRGTDEYEIALPAGYAVDELPDPVHMDVGFASYDSKTELLDGKLHYTRIYTQREVSLPPEKYPQLQKLAMVIANDEESRAVLKRASQQDKTAVAVK